MNTSSSSLTKKAFERLVSNKLSLFGGIYILLLITLAIFTPLIAPYDYAYQDLSLGPVGPTTDHLLGTDTLGRDLLTRMLYGSRISLMVGFLATMVALVIGVLWGAIAGFLGGRVDAIMMRIVDILYGIPFIILIILLMVIFGRNLVLLFMAIGAVEWLTMSRIVRSQVMSLSKQEFVLAAEAMGVSKKVKTLNTECHWARDCLRNFNRSSNNAVGSFFEFSWAWRSGPNELLGASYKRWCRVDGRVLVVISIPISGFFINTVFP